MKADAATYLALLEELLGEGRVVITHVRGSSMLPAIADGAVVRLAPPSGGGSRVGEVVAIRDDRGKLLCHRVARVYLRGGQTWVQTWGDTSRWPDAPVPVSSVIGVVTTLVQGETDVPVAPRPAWRMRARYFKRDLRRRVGRSGATAETACCAVAGDDQD